VTPSRRASGDSRCAPSGRVSRAGEPQKGAPSAYRCGGSSGWDRVCQTFTFLIPVELSWQRAGTSTNSANVHPLAGAQSVPACPARPPWWSLGPCDSRRRFRHSRPPLSTSLPSACRSCRLGRHCLRGTPAPLPAKFLRPILVRLPADIASAQPSSVALVALKSSPAGVAVVTCLVSCPAPPCAGPIQIPSDPKPGTGRDPESWPLLEHAHHDRRVVTRPALTSLA
jgi:hypothetical protein